MPPLTRWFIKTSLVYCVGALIVGLALMLRLALDLPPIVGALQPAYFHLLMLGWIAQLIFGVAHWMFPKHTAARPRGDERLGWATYGLLNAGLLLRVIAEPLAAVQPGAGIGWVLVLSAGLQVSAGWLFVANLWPRVKER